MDIDSSQVSIVDARYTMRGLDDGTQINLLTN